MNARRRFRLEEMFGVGATIVPVIGGVPEIAAPVKLIQEAKFEPVTMPHGSLSSFMSLNAGDQVVVTMDVVRSGEHLRFTANSFITEWNCEMPTFHAYGHDYPTAIGSGARSLRWKLEGTCIADSNGALASLEMP